MSWVGQPGCTDEHNGSHPAKTRAVILTSAAAFLTIHGASRSGLAGKLCCWPNSCGSPRRLREPPKPLMKCAARPLSCGSKHSKLEQA